MDNIRAVLGCAIFMLMLTNVVSVVHTTAQDWTAVAVGALIGLALVLDDPQ